MKDNKSTFLFRLTAEEKSLLKKDAFAHEMNISEYLRFLIRQERERTKEERQ